MNDELAQIVVDGRPHIEGWKREKNRLAEMPGLKSSGNSKHRPARRSDRGLNWAVATSSSSSDSGGGYFDCLGELLA